MHKFYIFKCEKYTKEGSRLRFSRRQLFHEQIYKPGSVIIRSSIYAYRCQYTPATWGAAGPALCSHNGVAPDRVYSGGRFHTPSGELLPRLSTLTPK